MDLTSKLRAAIFALFTACTLFLAGYLYSSSKSAPVLADLKARIDVADKEAKATKKKQEEDNVKLSIEIHDSITRINDERNRVLQRQNRLYTSALAECAERANGTAKESETLTGLADFEYACRMDANAVVQWQRWAVIHNLPIAD